MAGPRDRRNLSAYARVKLVLKPEPLLRKEAKEKEYERKTTLLKSAKSSAPTVDTRKGLAKAAGVGTDTIAKGKVIEAKASEEVKAGGAKSDGEKVVRQKSAEPLETRAELAKAAHVSHDTIARAAGKPVGEPQTGNHADTLPGSNRLPSGQQGHFPGPWREPLRILRTGAQRRRLDRTPR
jgi:hypothetical protein